MQEWRWVPLSSLYLVRYGKANPGRTGTVPVVGSSGVYSWTQSPLITYPTVVIGRKGSAGQAWLVEVPSYPSDTTFYLEPKDSAATNIRFTYFALRQLQIAATEDVIPSLQRHELENLTVPVPPLPEQRAIAAVLAKVQAVVEVQEKIVATLRGLKGSTMAKLFREGLRGEPLKQTEIGEIPESWGVIALESVCEKMNYGTSVRCTGERQGWPVLRIPNVINEMVDTTDLKWTRLPDHEVSKLALEEGDVLFVRTNGNRQYTGRCAVYEGQPARALFASYLIRVRLAKGNVLPAFAQGYLSSVGREQITAKAHPAADGKYNIDTGVLKAVLLPRPSVEEQRAIGEKIRAIDHRLARTKERARTLRSLFSSMLHLLMTGRVRVTRKMIALQAVADRAARRPKWSGTVDEKFLQEVVRRIVEATAPEKIIVFGSAAR